MASLYYIQNIEQAWYLRRGFHHASYCFVSIPLSSAYQNIPEGCLIFLDVNGGDWGYSVQSLKSWNINTTYTDNRKIGIYSRMRNRYLVEENSTSDQFFIADSEW